MNRSAKRNLVLGSLAMGLTFSSAYADPPISYLKLRDPVESMEIGDPKGIEEIAATSASFHDDAVTKAVDTSDEETVRERFKSGRVHIEKKVVLDPEGNFINHGLYTEWNERGDLIQTGNYLKGKRDGVWIRVVHPNESKLLQSFPYNQFKAPFQSTAEFSAGKMHGVWAILDAENKVVSQISLSNGIRSGQAAWNFPNGSTAYEAEYVDGVLNGRFTEKNAAGKVVKQSEYIDGRVTQTEKEVFPNKQTKSEVQVLTNRALLQSADDFDTLSLAVYSSDEKTVRHGAFVFYHDNGSIRSRGSYVHGELSGEFESWHPNGERECIGTYSHGLQSGKWTWWHANGMRKSMGNYEAGKLAGELMAWNEQGKMVAAPTSDSKVENTAQAPEKSSRRR